MAFDDLHQEIILDHYRNPRNAAKLDDVPEEQVHENPSCGDSIKLKVEVDPSGGKGCAISTAPASIMTELMSGKSVEEVGEGIGRFSQIMRGEGDAASLEE